MSWRAHLRDHIIELGGLPVGEKEQLNKVKLTMLATGTCFAFGSIALLFGIPLGVAAVAYGEGGLGGMLLAGSCLAVGATLSKGVQLLTEMSALVAHQPGLPAKPRPYTRFVGSFLPLAVGAGIALTTGFNIAARLQQMPQPVPMAKNQPASHPASAQKLQP